MKTASYYAVQDILNRNFSSDHSELQPNKLNKLAPWISES